MKQKIVKISRGQYLSDIEPFKTLMIPSHSIIHKELPGLGATFYEIYCKRHSIIIEPNLPVILGKKKQHKDVFAIYEGVTSDDIFDYLIGDVEFKKLVTTPESFKKIRKAVEDAGFDYYRDFFFLFDECERVIQDVDFREDIALPLDDFFKFERKAFISATTLVPSDPRFESQNFTFYKLTPTFNYRQPLSLIETNNVFLTLKKFIDENPRERYFVFFNTTNGIGEIIQQLGLKEDSTIFCSEESKRKLRENGFKNIHTRIGADFKKLNAFTSRFFSAVDIEKKLYGDNPTIIMVTDLVMAEHTKIDPWTEAVQIQGRFRVPKGEDVKKEIVHISNFNSKLTSLDKNGVMSYLKECHFAYKVLKRYFHAATTIAAKDVLQQVLQRIDYAKFVKEDGSRHYDMVDNMLFDEQVKGYYQCSENLTDQYSKIKHFEIVRNDMEVYVYTDTDRNEARMKNKPIKSLNEILSNKLMMLHEMWKRDKITDFQYNNELVNLQFDFPKLMPAIILYGMDRAAEYDFNSKKISDEMARYKKSADHFAMITYIHQKFLVGSKYTGTEIKSILKKGMLENKIFGESASVEYLRKFCVLNDAKNRVYMYTDANGRKVTGYKIERFLDSSLGY